MSKYQGRVDPIELLRAVYTQDKKVRLKDKHLIFEKDIRLPLSQPTAWVSTLSNKQYTVGSLWLFLQNHLKRISDYITKITQYGVDNVTISDRQQIVNYFTGKIKESECINQEAKMNLSFKNNAQRSAPSGGFDQEGQPAKKVKTDPLQIQIIEQSYKFERPISSKTRSLRSHETTTNFSPLLNLLTVSQPAKEVSENTTDRKMRINALLAKKKNPILIVPEHLHPGNLCLGNIQKFLVNGKYEQTMGDVGFKQWIDFQYTLRGRKVKFDVTNNPKTLQNEDWRCVVGVFVEGRAGQFNQWRKNDHHELFRETKGFLLRFPTKQPSAANDWNIKMFTLDKNVRYRDSEISSAIWKDIEAFLYEKV